MGSSFSKGKKKEGKSPGSEEKKEISHIIEENVNLAAFATLFSQQFNIEVAKYDVVQAKNEEEVKQLLDKIVEAMKFSLAESLDTLEKKIVVVYKEHGNNNNKDSPSSSSSSSSLQDASDGSTPKKEEGSSVKKSNSSGLLKKQKSSSKGNLKAVAADEQHLLNFIRTEIHARFLAEANALWKQRHEQSTKQEQEQEQEQKQSTKDDDIKNNSADLSNSVSITPEAAHAVAKENALYARTSVTSRTSVSIPAATSAANATANNEKTSERIPIISTDISTRFLTECGGYLYELLVSSNNKNNSDDVIDESKNIIFSFNLEGKHFVVIRDDYFPPIEYRSRLGLPISLLHNENEVSDRHTYHQMVHASLHSADTHITNTISNQINTCLKDWPRFGSVQIRSQAERIAVSAIAVAVVGLESDYVAAYNSFLVDSIFAVFRGHGTSDTGMFVNEAILLRAASSEKSLRKIVKKSLTHEKDALKQNDQAAINTFARVFFKYHNDLKENKKSNHNSSHVAGETSEEKTKLQKKRHNHVIFEFTELLNNSVVMATSLIIYSWYVISKLPDVPDLIKADNTGLLATAVIDQILVSFPVFPTKATVANKDFHHKSTGFTLLTGDVVVFNPFISTIGSKGKFEFPDLLNKDQVVKRASMVASLQEVYGTVTVNVARMVAKIFLLNVIDSLSWHQLPKSEVSISPADFTWQDSLSLPKYMEMTLNKITATKQIEKDKLIARGYLKPSHPETIPQREDEEWKNKRQEELKNAMVKYDFITDLPEVLALIDDKYDKQVGELLKVQVPPFLKSFDHVDEYMKYTDEEFATVLFNKVTMFANRAFSDFEVVGSNLKHHLKSFYSKFHERGKNGKNIIEIIEERYTCNKYPLFSRPEPLIRHWVKEDEEFARMRIGGVSPMSLKKCKELPNDVDIPEGEMKDELVELISKGSLFVCDLRPYFINDANLFVKVKNRHVCVPIAFFKLLPSTATNPSMLMPVAIQLEPPNGIWFTPKDHLNAWLMAKFHFQCADGHVHQFRDHLALCHLVMEAIVISTQRSFSKNHPLWILLTPHQRANLHIDAIARIDMLARGGMIDYASTAGRIGGLQLIEKAYKTFSISNSVSDDIYGRGIDSENLPIDCPYRDDAMDLDNTIRTFVKNIIDVYYESDGDILEDSELQFWVKDNRDYSPLSEDKKPFPFINTKAELVNVITNIIFICTIQHSLLNYSQYDFYAFVPNYPLIMRHPPPKTKSVEEITDNYILESLPDASDSVMQIGMGHLLSMPTNETLLHHHPMTLYQFTNSKAVEVCHEYWIDLYECQGRMTARSENRIATYLKYHPDHTQEVPKSVSFTYCDPRSVAVSIQI